MTYIAKTSEGRAHCDLNHCKTRKRKSRNSPDYGRAVNRPGRSRGGAPSASLGLANLFPSFILRNTFAHQARAVTNCS